MHRFNSRNIALTKSPSILDQVFVGHWCNFFLLSQDNNVLTMRLTTPHFELTRPRAHRRAQAFASYTTWAICVNVCQSQTRNPANTKMSPTRPVMLCIRARVNWKSMGSSVIIDVFSKLILAVFFLARILPRVCWLVFTFVADFGQIVSTVCARGSEQRKKKELIGYFIKFRLTWVRWYSNCVIVWLKIH